MKPFRGKPKKPERSNGEIQRVSLPASGVRVTIGNVPVAPSAADGVANVCTSPLVERRDLLGAGLRAAVKPEFDASAFRSDPWFPTGPPDGTTVTRGRI